MAQDWVIRGLPARVAMDSWWLEGPAPAAPPGGSATGLGARGRRLAVLAALVVLADVLFYEQRLGLSLALFAFAVFMGTLALRPAPRPVAGPLALLILSALPVIDYVQALSLGFLLIGMMASLVWLILGAWPALTAGLAAALRLAQLIPFSGLMALRAGTRELRQELGGAGLIRRLWRAWAFPVGGGLVLLQLLVAANPLLADWLNHATRLDVNLLDWLLRAGFWLGTGLLVWPLLVAEGATLARPVALSRPHLPGIGINAASVGKALVMFNLLLGVQTAMDGLYLWSGAPLPPGMTLATYAHRGAYPLLATALLAGAFALAARPWLAEQRMLKPLVLLWLGQNVLLTLSAVYRLDAYVQSFGLTYLRVHAGIWMLLVAAGLALTAWQVAAGRSNLWLVLRCAALGLAVLYLCAFVNFAAVIATVNLREGKLDRSYLCSLGPTAAAAIAVEGPVGWSCRNRDWPMSAPRIEGWRDWGYRNWRVSRYLKEMPIPGAAHENPGRR